MRGTREIVTWSSQATGQCTGAASVPANSPNRQRRADTSRALRPQTGLHASRRPQVLHPCCRILRRAGQHRAMSLTGPVAERRRAPAAARLVAVTARRAAAALLVAVCAIAPAAAHGSAAPNGSWVLPIGGDPVIARGYDPPAQPWLAGHRGVDLAAPAGTVVLAAGRGVVTYAGMLAGRGVVAVSHGELRTTYEPVIATVGVGEHVEAGQPIGTLGAAGSHCAPAACLHWGLLRGESYRDPLELLGGRVRLLPLGPNASVPTDGPIAPGSAPMADQPAPPVRRIGSLLAIAAAAGAG